MNAENPTQIHATGEATGFIPAPGDKGKPITVIGTNSIRAGFDATCLQQALNARSAPGVTDLVLGYDGTNAALALRLEWVRANQFSNFLEKITQLVTEFWQTRGRHVESNRKFLCEVHL